MKKRIYIIWMVLLTFKVIGQTDFLTKAKSYYNLDSNIVYGEKHLRQSLASTYNSKDIIKAYRYVVSNYFNKGKFLRINLKTTFHQN